MDLITAPVDTPRKTKLVCTLGPACWSEEGLGELMDAGMNVARFNFSHGEHSDHKQVRSVLRTARAPRTKLGGMALAPFSFRPERSPLQGSNQLHAAANAGAKASRASPTDPPCCCPAAQVLDRVRAMSAAKGKRTPPQLTLPPSPPPPPDPPVAPPARCWTVCAPWRRPRASTSPSCWTPRDQRSARPCCATTSPSSWR